MNETTIVPYNVLTKYVPLIVGDLHISDKYSGRHVDYFADCVDFINQITDEIKKNKVTHLFLTGDLIGRTTEKNLQSRDTLMYFIKVLQVWNDLTNGNVYSARGNHDYAENLTDFEFFVTIGVIKTANFVDVGAARIHLIDFADHNRALDIDEDKYNVAIMHTNLQIEGITTWFVGGNDGVELSSLENLYGVELVIAGHIHNPSIRTVTTSIRDKDISLFYPGCGTRPRYEPNIWNKCYGVMLTTDEDDVQLGQITFDLKDGSTIFKSTFNEIEEDEVLDDAPMFDIAQLSEILQQLNDYNILGESDYKEQVTKFGGIDKDAVELALSYIEKVEAELK
jgi:predicted phosphodiesterase